MSDDKAIQPNESLLEYRIRMLEEAVKELKQVFERFTNDNIGYRLTTLERWKSNINKYLASASLIVISALIGLFIQG